MIGFGWISCKIFGFILIILYLNFELLVGISSVLSMVKWDDFLCVIIWWFFIVCLLYVWICRV